MQSLASYFDRFQRLGREIAYVDHRGYRARRCTYAELAGMAADFARMLRTRGIGKGDRVLLWAKNSSQWAAAFWGCVFSGVVVVPMDAIATLDFAQRVAEQVQAKLAVCDRSGLPLPCPTLPIEDIPIGEGTGELPSVESQGSDLLQIVFTSGTTSDPKGVVLTHGNVLANIAPIEAEMQKYLKYERLVHPLRFLNVVPLSHVFGQFMGLFLPPLLGGTVIFSDSLSPSRVIDTIRRERVSVLVAVPRILESLQESVLRDLDEQNERESFDRDFRAAAGQHFLRRWWRFRRIRRRLGWKFWAFICGGAALAKETEEFWARLGYAVVQGYGLTETTSLISLNHPLRTGKGSIGKILAGRDLKLDANGEILVRGASVAAGYWSGGELKPVATEDGWYRTGDAGELDAEGSLYFKGRKKETIVTPAGMNVYPEDLEAALRAEPEVRDCVVFGMAVGSNAEPVAVLLLQVRDANAGALMERVNAKLAEYQRIRRWHIWPEGDFPRTSTQKAKRGIIAELVRARIAGQPAAASANSLSDLLTRVTGRAGAGGLDANLEADLNLDSIARVSLMSALEDRYQLDLSETSFSAVKTTGDLERLLQGRASEKAVYHYPRWSLRWPVPWIRFAIHYLLARPAVFLLAWPRIVGRENLQSTQGPCLVIANHISHVDVGYVLASLPFHLRHKLAVATGGEALQALRTPPSTRNWFLRIYDRIQWVLGVTLLNLFPLPRQAGFRDSFAYAGECIDRGYSVLVFPEGRHTETGKMWPFRAGIGILAKQLRVPVIPMRIDGLFELKQAGKRWAPPGCVQVHIGKPVQVATTKEPAQIAQELQQIVEGL